MPKRKSKPKPFVRGANPTGNYDLRARRQIDLLKNPPDGEEMETARWEEVLDMATNPSTPVLVLEQLLASGFGIVKAALASNVALPHSIFQTLLGDEESDVAEAVLNNPAIPFDLLEQAAKQHPIPDCQAYAREMLGQYREVA